MTTTDKIRALLVTGSERLRPPEVPVGAPEVEIKMLTWPATASAEARGPAGASRGLLLREAIAFGPDCLCVETSRNGLGMPFPSALALAGELAAVLGVAFVILADSGDPAAMREAMRDGAADFIFPPFTPAELRQTLITAATRAASSASPRPSPSVPAEPARDVPPLRMDGFCVTVFGTKGGVGKTTMAVNLATALALGLSGKRGERAAAAGSAPAGIGPGGQKAGHHPNGPRKGAGILSAVFGGQFSSSGDETSQARGATAMRIVSTGPPFLAGGRPVSLVDLDLEFGGVASFFGLEPTATIHDLCRLDGPLVPSLVHKGLIAAAGNRVYVLAAPPTPELAAEIDGEARRERGRNYVEEIVRQLKVVCSFVVIDTPSTFRESTLTALDLADQVLVVTTPDIPTLQNTAKGLDILLRRLRYPPDKVTLILNRADAAIGLTEKDIAGALGVGVAHRVPSDGRTAVWAANTGHPLILTRRRIPIVESLWEITRDVAIRAGAGVLIAETEAVFADELPVPPTENATGRSV